MFCTNCGKGITLGNKFCTHCGNLKKQNFASLFSIKLSEYFKNPKFIVPVILGITILIVIINGGDFFESNNNSEAQLSNEKINTVDMYGQNKNSAAVVNIFCPSVMPEEETSGGSGTIISDDGIILTNSHIIPQDETDLHVGTEGCLVVMSDAITGQAEDYYLAHPIVLSGISDKYDLAFMQIYSAYYDDEEKIYMGVYPRTFPKYICENTNVKLGDPIRVFGYPSISGGYSLTVTDGVVSSLTSDGLIYTSAKISHGNSGGLATDKDGCMIGVPSMVSSDENESLGIIYSMDLINEFAEKVSEIIE